MNDIARIIAFHAKDYLEKGRKASSETRLLIPGLTDHIAEQFHDELVRQGLRSYLVVRKDDKQVPDEGTMKILADGLTSVREGEMLIVAQPGQISHIQDSIRGSGGTIRSQSFSDEWPWVEAGNENYAFPSLDEFIHKLIHFWGLSDKASEWLHKFIVEVLIPETSGESDRAEFLLERLLGEFVVPGENSDNGKILRSFLRHCGIPQLRKEWIPYDDTVEDYAQHLLSVGSRVAEAAEDAEARNTVLDRAREIGGEPNGLTKATDLIFDSFGSDTHRPTPLFLFRGCFTENPSAWDVLDLDTISKLFDGFRIESEDSFIVQVSLGPDQSGSIRDSEKGKKTSNIYVPYGTKLFISVKTADGKAMGGHSSAVVSKRGKQILSKAFENTSEISLVLDTSDIEDSPREILLKVEFYEEPKSSSIELYKLRVNLAGESRPFFVLLPDISKPIDACLDNEDDSAYLNENVTRPQIAEVICRRDFDSLEGFINDDPIQLIQLDDYGCHFRIDEVIDPAAIHRLTSLVKVTGGAYTAAAFIGMEEVERGYFTLEDDLRETLQQFTSSRKKHLREIIQYFNEDNDTPYPYLGNIDGATQKRVHLCKKWIETNDDGGYPIVLDLNFLDDPKINLSRGRYFIGVEKGRAVTDLDPQGLSPGSEKALSNYLSCRSALFKTVDIKARHPAYAARPIFLRENEAKIKTDLSRYLNAYRECILLLLEPSISSSSERFLLSWLDCVVHLEDDGRVPLVLLGPWHPLVLAQRYMVQKALYDAASRQLSDKGMPEGYCRLAFLFSAIVGCRWIPFADPKLGPSVTDAFYVSATSDPGWLVASKSLLDENNDTAHINLLDQALGLTVWDSAGQGSSSIDGYLKAFMSAHPGRRALSVRVDSGYSLPDTIKSVQRLLNDRGNLLPGGVHLVFKDVPRELSAIEWQDPPILAYDQKEDPVGDVENPIDIYLLQGNRLEEFDQPDEPLVCPRGLGLFSAFTEPLMQLHSSRNSTLHESGVGNETDPDPFGDSYYNLLRCLDSVQKKKRAAIVHSYLSKTQGAWSWIVIPARHVDPAILVELVRSQHPDQNSDWTLWDYKIDIGRKSIGHFTLSRVGHDIKSILEGNQVLAGEDPNSILRELGGIGIALAGEIVRSSATAQGAIGLIGALRLINGFANSEGLLKNEDPGLVAFTIPVDSFEEIFRNLDDIEGRGGQRTDLLAVQIQIDPNTDELEFSFLGVEAKYTKNKLTKARARVAIEQARRTVTQVICLAQKGIGHGLERLAFMKLISYGLRLSAPARSAAQLDVINTDFRVLRAIVRGEYTVRNLKYNAVVVSTELECGMASIERNPAIWIRLSVGHWPNLHTNSSEKLAKVLQQLAIFRDTEMLGIDGSNEEPIEVPQADREGRTAIEVQQRSQLSLSSSDVNEREGVKIIVGSKLDWPDQAEPMFFHPSNTELNQLNVGIVGDLGTGKTQKIKALIKNLSERSNENCGQPIKVLIFDYKGDYTADEFSQATGAQIIVPKDIPLNVLDVQNAEGINPQLDRANFFTDVLTKIYAGIGHKQGYFLKQAIRNCYEVANRLGVSPTIYDVHDAYKDSRSPDSVLSILDNFTSYGIFESDLEKIKKFEDFFSGVTVIDLKALGTWDQGKTMLVVIFLNMFYEYMLRVEKKPFVGVSPQLRALNSILLIDEADQVMRLQVPILRRILLQGREFGVGVILASQYLSHFKQDREDYREPLLTWLIHKVPNISVKELTEIGVTDATDEVVNRIKNLDKHHSFYKTSIGDPCFIRNTTFFEQN